MSNQMGLNFSPIDRCAYCKSSLTKNGYQYVVVTNDPGDCHAPCFLAYHDPAVGKQISTALITSCRCMECGEVIEAGQGCAIFRSPFQVKGAVIGHVAITHTVCLPAYCRQGGHSVKPERSIFINARHD